jgi:hypothetical protein
MGGMDGYVGVGVYLGGVRYVTYCEYTAEVGRYAEFIYAYNPSQDLMQNLKRRS